jgi:hypothetical protein
LGNKHCRTTAINTVLQKTRPLDPRFAAACEIIRRCADDILERRTP